MEQAITRDEFREEINRLRIDFQKEARSIVYGMIGVIISIWAVTLLPASTLFLITR